MMKTMPLPASFEPEVTVPDPTWIERHVPGRHGDVRVREYTPSGDPLGPRLVWVHGGGWVVGTLDEPEAHGVWHGCRCRRAFR